jgi:hypothetical protein
MGSRPLASVHKLEYSKGLGTSWSPGMHFVCEAVFNSVSKTPGILPQIDCDGAVAIERCRQEVTGCRTRSHSVLYVTVTVLQLQLLLALVCVKMCVRLMTITQTFELNFSFKYPPNLGPAQIPPKKNLVVVAQS